MNTYTELWNYTLGADTLPYGINNGSPYTSGGFCYLPVNSFVNKDFAGYTYGFQGYNYVGHYAIKFSLDVDNAGDGSMFTILCYGGSSPRVPAIQRTATGVALGWTTYSNSFYGDSGNGATATGDFDGRTINETGVYTVVHAKKVTGTYNDVMLHVITPSGAHYYTGWSTVTDGSQHIQIGNNTSGSGEWKIGPLAVSDDLTEAEAELFRTTGALIEPCATPVIAPAQGSYDFSVDVTISCATPSSTIYYTTDGSTPTAGSSVYSAALHITANTVVKAFATAAGLQDSSVATASYTVVANPSCAKPVIVVSGSGATRNVEMSCATSGASIYYTTDGTNPSASSTLYTGTFQVADSQTVKAVALKTLYKRSPYAAWSKTLRFGNAVILGFEYLTIMMPDGKEWLAENLAWDGAGQWWNNGATDDGDGRYYNVPEVSSLNAMLSSGWRVSTHADWVTMVEVSRDTMDFVCVSSCAPARWPHANVCTNANGFSALPTSNYNGTTEQWQLGFKDSRGWWWQHIDVDLGQGTGYKNVTIREYNNVVFFDPSDLYSPYPYVTGQNTRLAVRLVREKCANPEISRLSGDYAASSISVKLTCPDENAKFFYTTDGSDPTESSTPYSEPITVNSSLTLKVIASNGVPSDVVSATYVLNASLSKTRELSVPWSNADDLWVTHGAVSFNAGTLSADAANGHASWLPAYGTPTQMDVTNVSDASTLASYNACYEYDVELAANSTLVFGLNENKTYLSLSERTFEFYRESDSSVRFVVRRGTLTGFDGSLTVGSRFKIRLAHNSYSINYNSNYSNYVSTTAQVRLAVVAQDGTVVADSNWQTCAWFMPGYVQDSWFYRHPYYGSQAFVLKRGQATLRPFRVVSICSQSQCVEFITTGSTAVVPVPVAPQISVDKLRDELNRVIISPAAASDSLIITVDEGYFINDAYDIVRNKRAIMLAPGELYVRVVSGQCVFRAISASNEFGTPGYNEVERRNYAHLSAITTQEVGDSTVAIPEISPRRDEIEHGFPTPVNVYCSDVDATVRYTTDGSLPTASSPVWNGTMQVREPLWLRVRSFKDALASPAQNGLYTVRNEPMQLLPSAEDSTLWTGTNASFTAGGIVVNDPAGDGVVMRDDIAIDTSHLDISCVRFRASGPFRLKIPGVNGLHLAWVGDKIGLVTRTDEEPATDFAGQTYADVRVAFSAYIDVYQASIPAVIKYAHIDIAGSSVVVAIPPAKSMVRAANKIGFTSEGLSSFTITNLEIIRFGANTYQLQAFSQWRSLLALSAFPLPKSDKPVFNTYVNDDITDQPIVVTSATNVDYVYMYCENETLSKSYFSPPSTATPIQTSRGADYTTAAAVNLENGKLPRVSVKRFNSHRLFACDVTTWDRAQSWSDHYIATSNGSGPGLLNFVEQPTQLTNERYRFNRRWSKTELVNPVAMQGNSWFSFSARSMYNNAYVEEHRPEYDIFVGFDTPSNVAMPVLSSRPLKGIDASRIANSTSSIFEVAKIIRRCDLTTFETAAGARVASTAGNHDDNFAIWNCGRKIVAGILYVRVTARHDWQLTPFYDSGWIDCGASATQPKPKVIVRARTLDGSWFPLHLVNCFYGHDNLQESELETLFDYGTLTTLAAPTLTASNTLNSDGTVDVTVSAPGSSRVLVFVGDQEPQMRVDSWDNSGVNKNYYRRRAWYSANSGDGNSKQDDDFFTSDGATFQVPALSQVRAVSLAEPYQRYIPISGNNLQFGWFGVRSSIGSVTIKRPASDLITINTAEPRTAVIRCSPPANMFTLEYSGDDWGPAMAHGYKLVFDDGLEYELQAWTYSGYERINDLVRQLPPGQHWVKLVRFKTTASFGSYALGESDKLLFTVSENLALQTATPSSVVAGATAVFSAAGGASSFTWFFSDGTSEAGPIVNKAFEKPGRYTWCVVADDGKEQCQSSGSFVVTFTTATLPENMTSTEELRVS